MGFAYVLQGRCVEHAIQAFKGCTERITAVTSFRPRNPFLQDLTRLCNVYEVSDASELCSQFCQYRMLIAIQRLTALIRMLNGEQDVRWEPKSPLLGHNIEDIRQILQETREQLGMRVDGERVQLALRANNINLKSFGCTTHTVMYALHLDGAVKELTRGIREQRDAGIFDLELFGRTFESVDSILQLICDTS